MPSPELGAGPLLTTNAINAAINAAIVPMMLPFCELDFRLVVVLSATEVATLLLSKGRATRTAIWSRSVCVPFPGTRECAETAANIA
jgi:hypothetical protein